MESTAIGSKLEGYLNKNVTDYLNSSSMDNGVWATDAEIIPTANLLGCDINVYCKMGEKLNWQRFPAQFTLSHRCRVDSVCSCHCTLSIRILSTQTVTSIRPVTHYAEAAKTLVQAFISCRLDYCNSLLYGVTENV